MLCTIAIFLAVTGCAVQMKPNGPITIDPDYPEIFGREIGNFSLPNDQVGKLREWNGDYSIKLPKYFKVISLLNAKTARIVRSDKVGDRTVVVIEKSERQCNYITQIMSILDSSVLTWDFGDCSIQPIITTNDDSLTFDYPKGRNTVRFTYRDSRLVRSEFAGTHPTIKSDTLAPLGASIIVPRPDRYIPSPPILVMPGISTIATTSVVPVDRKPVSPSSNTRPSTPQRPLEFPVEEQKPIRIVLDK
jgi:hypothetical protein